MYIHIKKTPHGGKIRHVLSYRYMHYWKRVAKTNYIVGLLRPQEYTLKLKHTCGGLTSVCRDMVAISICGMKKS